MDKLYAFFPTPIMHRNVTEQINPAEINLLKTLEQDVANYKQNKNLNYFHNELDVLNKVLQPNSTIATAINDSIQYFIQKIWGEGDSKLAVTQSWLNFNPPGTSHAAHSHANSILSGVLYINVDETTGDIKFHNPYAHARTIRNTVTEHNDFTYENYSFKPNYLDLFVFPSNLFHSVENNTSNQTRISLAFNTFYTGHIAYSNLAQLRLEIKQA